MRRFSPYLAKLIVFVIACTPLLNNAATAEELKPALIGHALSAPWLERSDHSPDLSTSAGDSAAALTRIGGSRTVLKMDPGAVRDLKLEELKDDVRRLSREAHIGYSGLAARDGGVEVRIRDESDLQQAMAKLSEASKPLGDSAMTVEVRNIGERVIRLTPTDAAFNSWVRMSRQRTIDSIERIAKWGHDTVDIQSEGLERLVVLAPGVSDFAALVHTTPPWDPARVSFRLIDASASGNDAADGRTPSGSKLVYGLDNKTPYLVEPRVVISGWDVAEASPMYDRQQAKATVVFRFNARVTRLFADITRQNIGRSIAIMIADQVILTPIISEPVLDGSAEISGSFTVKEANDLALLLRNSMSIRPMVIIGQQTIEAAPQAGQQ
jgi:preprotein translocase subunit SecD